VLPTEGDAEAVARRLDDERIAVDDEAPEAGRPSAACVSGRVDILLCQPDAPVDPVPVIVVQVDQHPAQEVVRAGNRAVARQVGRAAHREDFLVEQQRRLVARPAAVAVDDGDIDLLGQAVRLHVRRDEPQVDLAVGVLEARQARQQPERRHRLVGRHGQPGVGLGRPQARCGVGHVAERQRHGVLELAALRGQAHGAMGAGEERAAEVLFQESDLAAHRRLGQAELLGGGGEAGEPGRRLEGDEELERRQVLASASHNAP
jgi:hypothetical protein